jgi:hypothetical protein
MNAFIWSRYCFAEASVPASAPSSRGVKFPGRHRLETRAGGQGHDVQRAYFHRLHQVCLGNGLADHDRRHVGGVAVADLERGPGLVVVRNTQEDELRRGLRQRLAECGDVPGPGAVNGLPRVAQRAVDGLHRVLLAGQDQDGDGSIVGQSLILGGAGPPAPR